MKKLFGLLLFVGAMLGAFAQVPSTQPGQFPGPYITRQSLYRTALGADVPFVVVSSQTGITYCVFDTSVSQADFNAAFTAAQRQANATGGSDVLVPIVVPGVVATGADVQAVRLRQDFSVSQANSGSTLATVPDLQVWVGSASTFSFRAVLYVSLGVGGSKVDYGGPAGPPSVIGSVTATGGTAIVYSSQQTAFLSGPPGSASSAVNKIVIEGTFTTNNGGIFVIQFAQNISRPANSTVKAGSTLTVTQLP